MKFDDVQTVVDQVRGCGWRKPGGLYLRADGPWHDCGKMPVPLHVCPTCHAGWKPARAWTFIDPRPLVKEIPCRNAEAGQCKFCVLGDNPPERAAMLWVGEKWYKTTGEFLKEANRLGVSRRITSIPFGFKVGETYVMLAHRLAIESWTGTPQADCKRCKGQGEIEGVAACECRKHYQAAIFMMFKPNRIEYVCKGDETEEQLNALVERGITPVKVVRKEEPKNK